MIKGHKDYVDSEGSAVTIPENTFEVSVSQIAGENYDGVTMPGDVTTFVHSDGRIEFDKIKFTKVGTYKFKVKETASNPVAGVAYDTAEKEVKVTVANDGGTLKATADSEPRFRNVFTSVKKNLRVKEDSKWRHPASSRRVQVRTISSWNYSTRTKRGANASRFCARQEGCYG